VPLSLDQQNAYRARYAKQQPGWRPATEQYETLIRSQLKPDQHVLDIGCGRGGALEQLGVAVAFPIGIDPDHLSLVEHRLPDLPRAVALSSAIPLADHTVDLVLCSWVLEHISDPALTFSEIARVLRPGGTFIWMTPNANSLPAILNRVLHPLQEWLVPRLYGRHETDAFPVAYRANTQRQLDQLARNAGLQPHNFRRIEDPTYFAFHPLLFRVNVLLARTLPRSMAEHLVGAYSKL
jgi:ubiquinone/menaquinone biosynthesis C-methylase UbiE